jgi:hypothetical protein
MIKLYLLFLLGIVLWKGFWAWKRGMRTYLKDRQDHDSLREYLLGNGATEWEARRPFINHALVRALNPLLSQWRLFLILGVLGVLIFLLS